MTGAGMIIAPSRRADNQPQLKALEKEKNRDAYARKACELWYDVRAFGQVFAFKKGAESDATSIGIRGPVSIQTAVSVDPVTITDTQITKSVNLETGNDPDKKGSDTMGMKHRVDFGLYVTKGAISVQAAQKTGFSDEDAEKLRKALCTLFVDDATSARPDGSMEIVKVIWWKHNCPIGQYSSAKVHRTLKIQKKPGVNTPSSAADYDITLESLNGLTPQGYDGE